MHSRVFKRLSALVAGLALALPALPAQAHHTRPPFELTFPQQAAETTFSNTWGARRPGGRRHRGSDLLAPRLTEVYAAEDGVIVKVDFNRSSGRNVRIDHGDGWTSHYLHLNNDNPGTDDGEAPWSMTVAPRIEVGREVKKGQVIGWVGDSGNAEDTVPHTHFEIRLNGRAINPYYALLDAYERDLAHVSRMSQLMTDTPMGYVID